MEGTQLALPLGLPPVPRLRKLGRWQRLIADYATSGVTVGDHVMAALRPRLEKSGLTTSAQLARLPTGSAVTVAGLVIVSSAVREARTALASCGIGEIAEQLDQVLESVVPTPELVGA